MSLSAWQAGYSRDVHSVSQTAEETFVVPGSDYHLLETSPAIDGGTTLTEITDDLDGNARPQGAGYDMGAYESVSASCPPCSGDAVTLQDVTFPSGVLCERVGAASITIGSGVSVPFGAAVVFKAPIVYVIAGFSVGNGSTIFIRQK